MEELAKTESFSEANEVKENELINENQRKLGF